MPLTFGGLASGLDTNAIVTSLVSAERAPIRQMQSKQSETRSQLSVLTGINTKLAALKTKAETIDTMKELGAVAATSSDSTKVGVTAGSNATAGTFAIDDVVLATTQKSRSNTFLAKDSPIGTGTLNITQGGVTYPITVNSENATLEGVAASINTTSGLELTASVFYDGSQYRLLLSSDKTGAPAAFTVDDSGLTGPRFGVGDPGNTLQAAGNASFKLDGQPVTATSNTVADVLPGITFELKKAFTSSPLQVTMGPDVDTITSKIRDLVNTYNAAAYAIADQFKYTGNGKPQSGGSLFGDSTIRSVQKSLGSLMTSPVAGLPDDGNQLSDFGIAIDRAGILTLDEAKLRASVVTDPRAVQKVFASDGGANGIAAQLKSTLDTYLSTTGGLLTAKSAGLTTRITDYDARIAAAEARVTAYEKNLRAQFTNLEKVMSRLNSQGSFIAQAFAR